MFISLLCSLASRVFVGFAEVGFIFVDRTLAIAVHLVWNYDVTIAELGSFHVNLGRAIVS